MLEGKPPTSGSYSLFEADCGEFADAVVTFGGILFGPRGMDINFFLILLRSSAQGTRA